MCVCVCDLRFGTKFMTADISNIRKTIFFLSLSHVFSWAIFFLIHAGISKAIFFHRETRKSTYSSKTERNQLVQIQNSTILLLTDVVNFGKIFSLFRPIFISIRFSCLFPSPLSFFASIQLINNSFDTKGNHFRKDFLRKWLK